MCTNVSCVRILDVFLIGNITNVVLFLDVVHVMCVDLVP